MGHHNLSRRRKLCKALRRSWGRVEKNFELSTTTGIATRAHEGECNDENYNPQQGAKATSATKPMGQVLRYKAHESSNMAVAVRRTLFTNPRAQSAALLGKTRPDHVHARAIAEERS